MVLLTSVTLLAAPARAAPADESANKQKRPAGLELTAPGEVPAAEILAAGTLPGTAGPVTAEQPFRPVGKSGSDGDVQAFGYDVFSRTPTLSETLGAVDPDYPVSPGDEIRVTAWGQVELSHLLTVDREGGIQVPRVGRLQIAGTPLRDLEGRILRFLATSYSTIAADSANRSTSVDVTLGKLRTIQVYVLGEVRHPGACVVQGASTVLNALAIAGGPLPTGSLRQVRLLRHDQLQARIDFYGFLLQGDTRQEVRLQQGDVIVVPPIGKTVTLQGRVHRPARYELNEGEGLRDLLDLAGGLDADAYARRVQVERIVANEERQIVDVDHSTLVAQDGRFDMQDGDRVMVFGIPDRFANAVSIQGVVRRPGTYELKPGMRVSDLVEHSEGLLEEAYQGRLRLVRTHADKRRQLVSLHLGRALAGDPEHNLELEPLDEVTIYSIHTFRDPKWVHIEGLVRSPGRYELLAGMTLQDLIASAGGLQEEAYRLGAEIARSDTTADGEQAAVVVLMVPVSDSYEVTAYDPTGAPVLLQDGDHVFVRRNPESEPQRYVLIEGQVRLPGRYALLSEQERLSDLVARAGGLRPEAYSDGVLFVRAGVGHVSVDLSQALITQGGDDDLVLRAGDEISVPQRSATVAVVGAVQRPMAVVYQHGAGPDYYLERAGGLRQGADGSRIYLEMPNGEIRLSKRILWLWRRWPKVLPGSRIVVPAR